jgi:hypothetical protein
VLAHQPRQDRAVVARACTDVQHRLAELRVAFGEAACMQRRLAVVDATLGGKADQHVLVELVRVA